MSRRTAWIGSKLLPLLPLLLLLLAGAGCGQRSSGSGPDAGVGTAPAPATASSDGSPDAGATVDPDAPWELFSGSHAGSPPFETHGVYINSTGEVLAFEICEDHSERCSLGYPGARPTNCRSGKHVLLRARAAPSAIDSLGKVLRSPAFHALEGRYVDERPDASSFSLSVRVAGLPVKWIKYSPWSALDKVAAGDEVTTELARLLSALEAPRGECVDRKTVETAYYEKVF